MNLYIYATKTYTSCCGLWIEKLDPSKCEESVSGTVDLKKKTFRYVGSLYSLYLNLSGFFIILGFFLNMPMAIFLNVTYFVRMWILYPKFSSLIFVMFVNRYLQSIFLFFISLFYFYMFSDDKRWSFRMLSGSVAIWNVGICFESICFYLQFLIKQMYIKFILQKAIISYI